MICPGLAVKGFKSLSAKGQGEVGSLHSALVQQELEVKHKTGASKFRTCSSGLSHQWIHVHPSSTPKQILESKIQACKLPYNSDLNDEKEQTIIL